VSPFAFRGAVTGIVAGGAVEVLFIAPVASGEHVVQVAAGLLLEVLFGLVGARVGLRIDTARWRRRQAELDTRPAPRWDQVTRSMQQHQRRWTP
jgi:hypothetical protein